VLRVTGRGAWRGSFFPPPGRGGTGEASWEHRDAQGNQTRGRVAFALPADPSHEASSHQNGAYAGVGSVHHNLLSRVDGPKGDEEGKGAGTQEQSGEGGEKPTARSETSDAATDDTWNAADDDFRLPDDIKEKMHHSGHRPSRVPKNMKDAVAVSCPLFFGGFSRRSPVRLKCFAICKSPTWDAIFLLVTITSCVIIAVAPEAAGARPGSIGGSLGGLIFVDYACVGIFLFEASLPPHYAWRRMPGSFTRVLRLPAYRERRGAAPGVPHAMQICKYVNRDVNRGPRSRFTSLHTGSATRALPGFRSGPDAGLAASLDRSWRPPPPHSSRSARAPFADASVAP